MDDTEPETDETTPEAYDAALTRADEGKRVLSADGEPLGRIVEVSDGRGYVVRDPSLVDTIRAKLGWGVAGEEAHPLDEGSIETITSDAVYLRGTL